MYMNIHTFMTTTSPLNFNGYVLLAACAKLILDVRLYNFIISKQKLSFLTFN